MSKIFYKGMIEDVQNDKCTDVEIGFISHISFVILRVLF